MFIRAPSSPLLLLLCFSISLFRPPLTRSTSPTPNSPPPPHFPHSPDSHAGGHDKDYHDNVIFIENLQRQWYWAGPAGIWITYTQQQDGHQDRFYNNYMVQIADGDFAIGQVCNQTSPPGWSEMDATYITSGGDVLPPGPYTLPAAQTLCSNTAGCMGLTFEASSASPSGTIPTVYFKDHVDTGGGSGWYSWILSGRSPVGVTFVANNSYFTPTANVTECGMTVKQYQALSPYNDPGSTVGVLPLPGDILAKARIVLDLPASKYAERRKQKRGE